ncbi:hypothetical protein AHF37_02269 [Paragonimus kellicotti]|nr:hypothetical protein AHF37_02269 [Paragonimus kellicotti]
MSFQQNCSKRIPLSDAWLEEVQSEESDSEFSRPSDLGKKAKLTHDWTARDITSDEEDTDEFDDEDDADDEDWTVPDYEKKRSNRASVSVRHSASAYKSTTNRLAPQHQRDRSRTKPLPYSPRTQQSHHQAHPSGTTISRPGRPPSQLTKSSGRSKAFTRDSSFASTIHRKPQLVSLQPNKSLPHELTKPRQCFGPGCTRAAARPDTKYCSDECGLRLALRRLEILLPESLSSGCQVEIKTEESSNVSDAQPNRITYVAEQMDRARLKEIQLEKCTVHDRLVQLEMEHQQLTNLIACARETTPDNYEQAALTEDAKEAEQVEQMEPVVCVTCASEVSMRHALRHMEKCFQKMEGNTVFCANQKEQIVGTPLFCDFYDTQAKAYCKRLRVVCEHFKEPKLPPDTVCGFPLVRDVFVETGAFCCVPRNKCTRHLGWERLRRARVDIERYRQFIRMDDLLQEEQRIHQSIEQRGGLLGVLLHRTIDHNPARTVQKPLELKMKR